MNEILKCFCGRSINDVKTLLYHIQMRHQIGDNSYNCILPDCKKNEIKGYQNLERHFNTHHNYDERFDFLRAYAGPKVISEQSVEPMEMAQINTLSSATLSINTTSSSNPSNLANIDGLEDDLDMNYSSTESENDEQPTFKSNKTQLDSIKYLTSLKIVNHKKRYKISQKAATEISEEWRDFYHDLYLNEKLNQQTFKEIGDQTKSFYSVVNQILESKQLTDALNEREIIINGEKYVYYYVPLSDTIENMISNSEIMKYIFEEHKRQPSNQFYFSYKDANFYLRKNPSPNPKTILLQLQIYFDDFKLTSNNATNISIFYFTLMNLPYFLQSAHNEMQLLLVLKREALDIINFVSIFELVIEDLYKFNYNPIKLTNNFKIKVNLQSFSADNKGSNELMGISTCFSRGKPNRYCNLTTNDIKTLQPNLNCLYRGSNSLPDCLNNESREIPDNSAFAELAKDNSYCFALDNFHNFCSNGIFERVLKPILRIFYVETGNNNKVDWIKFQQLINNLITKYDSIKHRNGSIKGIDKNLNIVDSTGTQMSDFFLLFAYLSEGVVPRESTEFKIYLKLRKIYLLVNSPIIPKASINNLREDIKEFFTFYYECLVVNHNLGKMVPKIHNLAHYPEFIEEMGPAYYYDTKRGERENQNKKKTDKPSNQFKNKPYSIVKWSLLNVDYNFKEVDLEVKKILKVNQLSCPTFSLFKNFINLQLEVEILKYLNIKKVEFKLNYVFRVLGTEIKFVKIVFLGRQNDKLIIIGTVLKVVEFLENIQFYRVQYEEGNLIELNLDILDFRHYTFIEDKNLILKEHFEYEREI